MSNVYSAPKTLFHRLWREPPPSLAVEFTADGVAAARWTPGQGMLERLASEPLAEGALRPSPVRPNLERPEEVRRAVAAALERLGGRARGNLALFLPDVAARVSVLIFDQFPQKPEEAVALVRWRLKKTVPFEIEDAVVAYYRQGTSPQGQEIVVAAAPREVVHQYENVLESLGYQPGFVTPSSLAAVGLMTPPANPGAGTMLLRSAARLLTIVVTSGGRLRVIRATELPDGEVAHSMEEVVADAYGSAVFFQDNYGGGAIERIYLAGFGAQTAELQESVERELGIRAQPLVVPGARGEEVQFLGCYGMVAEQAVG